MRGQLHSRCIYKDSDQTWSMLRLFRVFAEGKGYFNPFMPKIFSHHYQLDESIFNFRVVGWYFSFLLKSEKKLLFANSGEPDQTPRFAASDLVLHCLPMSHEKDARLIWVDDSELCFNLYKYVIFI